jgi:predicted dehydrogenase
MGRWSQLAHLPAWRRDPRCQVVGCFDQDPQGIPFGTGLEVAGSAEELIARPDVDVIDVVTWNPSHYQYARAAIAHGKHVLCEKPVHHDYRMTRELAIQARAQGLRTKVGFTFRFSAAMMRMRELIEEGFVGRPLIFNGFEQNSQFLDEGVPMRVGEDPTTADGQLRAASLEGYGAPIIDLALWFTQDRPVEVVGLLTNQIPQRAQLGSSLPMPLAIDDADCFIGRLGHGGFMTIQSSYCTVGNYPGLEARIYGTEGAVVCRLVEEGGLTERLWGARKDAVEFVPLEVPQRLLPRGGSLEEPWPSSFYSNLVRDFIDDISDPKRLGGGNFEDAARVQEVIDAVELSHLEHRWVGLPLHPATGSK